MTDRLIRTTTLDDYEEENGLHRLDGPGAGRWAEVCDEIADALRYGGALWEFEATDGRTLAVRSGLLVERDGRVLGRWELWKS